MKYYTFEGGMEIRKGRSVMTKEELCRSERRKETGLHGLRKKNEESFLAQLSSRRKKSQKPWWIGHYTVKLTQCDVLSISA